MYSYLLNLTALGVSILLLSMWLSVKDDLVEAKKDNIALKEHYLKTEVRRAEMQGALQKAASVYSEELRSNAATASSTIDGYIAINKRLSVQLKTVSNTTSAGSCSSGSELNARAELHPETAKDLIGVTMDADSHVKALQETIKQLTNKEL